ncbi:MAG: hypothetical protein WHU10_02190 [Fimbriimonadales bacterium]
MEPTPDRAPLDPLLQAWLERCHATRVSDDTYELRVTTHRTVFTTSSDQRLLTFLIETEENLFGDTLGTLLAAERWEVGRLCLHEGHTAWNVTWLEPGRIDARILGDVITELRSSDRRLYDVRGRRVPDEALAAPRWRTRDGFRERWLSEAERWLTDRLGKVWRSPEDGSLACILGREGLQAICLSLASGGRWAVADAALELPGRDQIRQLRKFGVWWACRRPIGKLALRRDARLFVFSHAWPIGRSFSEERTFWNLGAACCEAIVFARAWRDVRQHEEENPVPRFEEAVLAHQRRMEEAAFEETMNRLYGPPPEWD